MDAILVLKTYDVPLKSKCFTSPSYILRNIKKRIFDVYKFPEKRYILTNFTPEFKLYPDLFNALLITFITSGKTVKYTNKELSTGDTNNFVNHL